MKKVYYFTLIFLFAFGGKTIAQSSLDFVPAGGAFPIIALPPSETTTNTDYLSLSNYHFFNPYYYNPAMAGIEGKKQINANWNRQFYNSYSLSYEQPVSSINSAFGMHFSYTSNYSSAVRYFGLAYNYGFQLDQAQLKLGLQFSQISVALNESLFGFSDDKKEWYNTPSMDAGLAFQYKQIRIGASVKNLFPSKFITADNITRFINVTNGERQFNISFANTIKLSKQWDWSLAVLLRNAESQDIHDFSSYISFRKNYFVGATFRTQVEHHWVGFVGVKIKEKVNLQFSFNAQKEDSEDRRFIETLAQFQF